MTKFYPVIDLPDMSPLYLTRRPAMLIELEDILLTDPAFAGRVRFNASKQLVELAAASGGPFSAMSDSGLVGIFSEIQKRYRFRSFSPATLASVLLAVAERFSYDPLAEWLRALRWDGTKRLAAIPELLGNSEPLPMARRFCECWMMGAAARALRPGCKMDNVLVLIGPQGAGKSQFLRKLGTAPGDFYLETIVDVRSKDGMQVISGSWIIEWAETEQLLKSDSSAVKSFISRQVDVYRPVYQRCAVSVPRRAVIAGTTNVRELLVDETGNRRFYVVKTGVKVALDQVDPVALWAEAVARVEANEPWWLTPDEDRRQELVLSHYEKGAKVKQVLIEKLNSLADEGVVISAELNAALEGEMGPHFINSCTSSMRELGWEPVRVTRDGVAVRAWRKRVGHPVA